MDARIVDADYSDPQHAADILRLLDGYARHPMGGGAPLRSEVRDNLLPRLAAFPGAFSLLCYLDGDAVGLVNCFTGFSTFKCRPLVNIHDMVVREGFRGQGIGQRLLQGVEQRARERGCCKLTLEVLEGNAPARAAYARFGFTGYELDPALGKALFWEKPVSGETE